MIQTITSGQHNQSFIEQFDMSLCSGGYHVITGDLVLPWGGDGVRGGYDMLYLKNSDASSGTAKLTFTLPQNTDANSQVRFEITTSNGQFGSGNYTFNVPDGTTDTHTFSAGEHYTWFCNASAGDVIMLTSTDGTSADIVSIIVTYIGSTSDTTKYVNDIVKKSITYVHLYEILDYIITPANASINTGELADVNTVVEMIVYLNNSSTSGPRFFSTNDTDTDDPGWGEPGTWGLQFEDGASNLSVKCLGDYQDVKRTGIYWSQLYHRKLRYNLTASGYLNIYNDDDTLYQSWDGSAYTDPSVSSSTPIKLFTRYASHEYIGQGHYIYGVKIWQNNVLVHDYVPAKQRSTNKCGLYDLVNNSFHINDNQNYSFGGVSKSTPEYIDDPVAQQIHINRIYHKGEIYWGNEPHVYQRYMPAQYCQNDNNNSSSQLAHATFSIPWAPSPTISHKIVTEFIPMSMPGNSYGYAVFFGGNVSNLQHMANVFGGCSNLNGNCAFGAYDPNVEFRNFTQYYNKLWRVEIESQAGTSNSHSYNVKIDVDGTNIINSPGSSTNHITGTFDPYFIFGGQILRSDTMFRQIYMKMYSFDIYDDNVLVYSLRPYYDTVDQLYGMYDLVNDRFYSSMYSAHPFTGEL